MTKTHAMMTKDGLSASVFRRNSGFIETKHTHHRCRAADVL